MKIYKILFVLFFTLFSCSAFCEELTISTNKDVLISGEPFYLTISYDGKSNKDPDLESLKNDFQIVSNSTSRAINIINGNVSQLKQWRIGLQPLKEGKIKIRPIKLDNLVSNYLDIEVKETTDTAYIDDSKHNSNAPFLQIKQISDTKSPYIQQQVTFLVTLYDSIGLRINDISINKESAADWLIVPVLDTPILDKDVVNGKRVNVIHYAFAGFPQKSGKIKEPRFVIDGYYLKNNDFSFPSFDDDFDLFGFNNVFNQQIPVKMQTNEAFSDVKPIPSDYKGKYWIPVSGLTIESEFKNIDDLKQGDAFNQIISISATGLQETMLPQLSFATIDGVKSYPEKPQISSKISKGMVISSAVINNVYIPNKTGEIIIPSFELEWFNVNTEQTEKSIIPQKIISVKDNPAIATNKNEDSVAANTPKVDAQTKIEKNAKKTETNIKSKNSFNRMYFIFAVVLIIILSVLNAFKNKNMYRNTVIKYIKKHDYKKAREALIEWAKNKFNDLSIKNITDISRLADNEEFSEQLSFLNKMIYSKTKESFNKVKFIEIFKNIDKLKYSKDEDKNPIPLLYD